MKKISLLIIVLALLLGLAGCIYVDVDYDTSRQGPADTLEVHFIDVGQGDAILVRTPEGDILIDGGERDSAVVDYLNRLGIDRLKLMVGTHPHSDHIGGLINVLKSIPVDEVLDPGVIHTSKTFEEYLTIIDEKDIRFTEGRAGMKMEIGEGMLLEILHPMAPSADELNDASIVSRISYDRVSFLFTGDAEKASEEEILGRGYVLDSTVLKLGHHGSNTSTSEAFLNAVDPEVVIILVGRDNSYGHPHEEVLNRLAEQGAQIYRTDMHGTIVVTTDGETYDIDTR